MRSKCKGGQYEGATLQKSFSTIIKNIKSMGYIRIIVDSKKCVANFDVGGGDEGSGGNSSSRGVNSITTIRVWVGMKNSRPEAFLR